MKDSEILKLIRSNINKKKIESNKWFFKTGKGEYGEGDEFLGLTLPIAHKLAKELKDISLKQIELLLESIYHEERLISLMILVYDYERYEKLKDKKKCEKIYKFYLSKTKRINNWDLVDSSAHKIVGRYLIDRDRKVLQKLAKSKLVWDRRIAIISTAWFIKYGDFKDTLLISDILLHDKHDLIHKAVGWMLREVGKRSKEQLVEFLKTRYMIMPRTMLRYSIEKFGEVERRKYIKGLIK